MLKISEWRAGRWVDRDSPAVFRRETTHTGVGRLRIGVPCEEAVFLILRLLDMLEPPVQFLYVLHTPRGEGEPGRYESPPLSAADAERFINRFDAFLSHDARHDLWLRSAATGDFLVWDRHNDVFVYGSLDAAQEKLRSLNYRPGKPPKLAEHQHHYRHQFDDDAAQLLAAFDWRRTPLRPEDAQFRRSGLS